jgi:DNA-directed RNA polymerase subunit RPC12/RpoP
MSSIRFYCVLCGTALHAAADSQHDLTKCHACSRVVPVPRAATLVGNFAGCQPVFPPRVLELSVTFQCTECSARLRTDARWEGREIVCQECGDNTVVPRWSTVPNWAPVTETGARMRGAVARPPIEVKAAVLSPEEIEFLRGAPTPEPGAAV